MSGCDRKKTPNRLFDVSAVIVHVQTAPQDCAVREKLLVSLTIYSLFSCFVVSRQY